MAHNYIADWQAFVAVEVAANFAYVGLFRSKYVRIRADDTSSRFPSSANSFRPVRTCTRYFHWKKQNLFPSLFDLSSTHSSGAKVNGEEKKRKNKRKKEREKKEGRGISFFCEHVLEQRNQYSSVSCLPSSSIDRDENRG